MATRPFHPDGYCGLYCAACPQFLATKRGALIDDRTACFGCKSDRNPPWCLSCNLKACAREKGIEFCFQCADYPCADLEEFKNDQRYPYHSEVYAYMKTIAGVGRETWLSHMKARWSCPECGVDVSWWDLACPECGHGLKGYKKPE